MDTDPEPEPDVNDDPMDVPNKNPASYCRFCFSETDVEPLFPGTQGQPDSEMYERLYECIGIRLTKENYYPSGICWMCSLTMEEFQCFRKRCLKYDALAFSLQMDVKRKPPYGLEKSETQMDNKSNIKKVGVIFRKGKQMTKRVDPQVDITSHPCPYCPRTFSRKMYFDQHMWKHRDLLQPTKLEGSNPSAGKSHSNGPVMAKKLKVANMKQDPITSTTTAALPSGTVNERSICCELCPRKFTRRMYYIQHLRKHSTKERLFCCRHCTRVFSNTRRRMAHEKKEHLKTINAGKQEEYKAPFSCTQCSKTFKYRYSLRMHLLNHNGQLPYACDICNCRFYSMAYLNVHKTRYHGPNAICGEASNDSIISCLYCTRSFLRECDRSSHIKQMHSNMVGTYNETDTGGLPELLEDCPPADTEGLTDPELLPPNVHEPVMVIKEEEPDSNDASRATAASDAMVPETPVFYCYSCAMSFDTEDMYAEHLDDQHPFGGEQMMEHLQSASPTGEQDEKEFRCPYCPKTFTRKWTMNEHLATHLGTRRYPCEMCPAIFSRDGYLRTHRSRKHPDEAVKYNGTFKCRFCPRFFVMERYKKVHEKIAHIKKGDVLPEGCDTDNEFAMNESNLEVDESNSSVVQEATSDDFDVQSTSVQADNIESFRKLVVILQPLPLHVLADYQWQLDAYDTKTFDVTPTEKVEESVAFSKNEDTTNLSFEPDVLSEPEQTRTKIGITLHPCGVCSKIFKSRTSLRKHSLYHSGQLPFRCDECGVQFIRYGLLKDHKTRYHGENEPLKADRYNCDYCPRIFIRKQDRTCHYLMVHLRDQSLALEHDVDASPTIGPKKGNRKDYVCKVCGMLYDNYHTCNRHIIRAHPTVDTTVKPMKLCHCAICAGIFKRREDWIEHIDKHPKVRSHHCEECIRKRRKKWGRKIIHRCNFCPKAFLHKPNLSSHLRLHKQQLRFPCSDCDAMYDRYRDLAAHKIRYHADCTVATAQYKCSFCPRIFMRQRDVNYHQLSVHADRTNLQPMESEEDLLSLDPTALAELAELAELADFANGSEKPIKLDPDLS